jgi:hypothetical protein
MTDVIYNLAGTGSVGAPTCKMAGNWKSEFFKLGIYETCVIEKPAIAGMGIWHVEGAGGSDSC